MRIRVKHLTRYGYPSPADLGPHIVRLRPAPHTRATVLAYNLDVSPAGAVRWQQDPWSNRVARVTFGAEDRTDHLQLVVDAAFDIRPVNPFDFFIDDRCEHVPFRYPDGLEQELAPFLATVPSTPRLADFVESVPLRGRTVDYLVALNRATAARIAYVIRNEPGIQTSEETLLAGRGSCRDSARLLVDALRARGLAARFVSGYLVQLTDEGIIPDEAKGVARDVVDLHAWAEAYVPGGGWVGLDGTSGLLCGEGHIPLACTVDPELAAPVTGTSSVVATRFDYEMQVTRIGHEPRPREPYDDTTWDAVTAAGRAVDARIDAQGLTLTVGGEPTWTSREHPQEPEWITEALGPTKWSQGLRLAREVSRRLGPGTLLLHRMGKQYPGESLPRWVLHILWRDDGVPVWRDPARVRLAPDGGGGEVPVEQARALAVAITERLGVRADPVPGYEDPWHFVQEEQHLPVDVDPLHADLDDGEERRRLAHVLGHGLGRPIGYAVPLQQWGARWRTGPWHFRRGHMFLVPGDSPMGLRLPLDRVQGGAPQMWPVADTTAAREPLTFDPRQRRRTRVPAVSTWATTPQTAPGSTRDSGALRTALCVEPRDRVLHVFLPPASDAAGFLELVAAVEDAAVECDVQVRVEGYPPPPDPRLKHCLVTPDPGVIEVNIPYCRTFAEYLRVVEVISDAANHAGLCTQKYQLDGREVGSGGGNHLTLGGPTTVESPFLARPYLLGGLLRYLQNHPSLSYLFTGLFVGPTSQAPRVDEARHDALYELELALSQVPPPGATVPPWLVDRLLRNLLADVSGNTHRTEVSIDKLYDPHSVTGRLGLVELRAFEMPPHERMAAAQVLLVRALVARLADRPYTQALVRWGSALHDRFMLPHYLWVDFEDVAADLKRVGLPIEAAWYRPFLEFRCPRMGTLEMEGGIELSLRAALEPWPTLGEEPAGPVVARYVDSSLERLEVKVRGMTAGRHAVAVNGVRVPLHATGTSGELVAGVRFRAWQPPHCLQPNVPIHHPLRFDVVDTWARRSLGACTVHVVHPGGRGYDAPPLTAFEAAARRAQRFTTEGHAPWPVALREITPHPEQPCTLDLRRLSV
jgi:uncharacterized protein (DUF2126 family)